MTSLSQRAISEFRANSTRKRLRASPNHSQIADQPHAGQRDVFMEALRDSFAHNTTDIYRTWLRANSIGPEMLSEHDFEDHLRSLICQELTREDEPRTARLDARLTAKQRAVIQRAADISGRSISDFVVHSAHEAALREIQNQVILRLSDRDSETLVAAMDAEPAEPTAAFKRAVATRDKLVRQRKVEQG